MIKNIVKLALEEDLEPRGDLSAQLCKNNDIQIKAQIIAKEDGILACSHIVQEVLDGYAEMIESEKANVNCLVQDGEQFNRGGTLIEIEASAILILGAERTLLNFLQRFCAIATYSHKLSSMIADTGVEILDTRKTMPGMRLLEKEAFKIGGGTNHRINLSDMIMLKENHLAVLGLNLVDAIRQAKKLAPVEVEINADNLDKLDAVIKEKPDQIMLDNFSIKELPELIEKIKKAGIKVELSGGITEENLLSYAKLGPDYISTSAAHTKVKNLDLSLKLL